MFDPLLFPYIVYYTIPFNRFAVFYSYSESIFLFRTIDEQRLESDCELHRGKPATTFANPCIPVDSQKAQEAGKIPARHGRGILLSPVHENSITRWRFQIPGAATPKLQKPRVPSRISSSIGRKPKSRGTSTIPPSITDHIHLDLESTVARRKNRRRSSLDHPWIVGGSLVDRL